MMYFTMPQASSELLPTHGVGRHKSRENLALNEPMVRSPAGAFSHVNARREFLCDRWLFGTSCLAVHLAPTSNIC